MSPKKKPRSLFDFSISYISRYLNIHCCTEDSGFLTTMDYIKTILPHPLQTNIGEWVAENTDHLLLTLVPSQVHLLLNLKAVRLVVTGSVVESGVVDKQDAAHIQKLTLLYGGSEERLPKVYNFLSSAVNLTHLECHNFCNDKMLSIISSSCKNLYCLDLRSCGVTDNGIIQLCGLNKDLKSCIDFLSKGMEITAASPCSKSLREIKLTMTSVMEPGIAIVLLVLTRLVLLRVPDLRMERVFAFLQTLNHKNIQSNLKEFHSRQQLDESQLEVLSNICPNLEYIQVSLMGNFEMDLRRMEQIVRLKKLTRAKFADVDSSALMWFLDKRGHQMKGLYLYTYPPKFSQEKVTITRHQLYSLVENCRNIETLCLEGYCLTNDAYWIDLKISFRKLKKLKLNSISISEEDLKLFLMGSFQLEELDIILQNTDIVNDQLIDQILNKRLWDSLVRIRILNAPLTSRALSRLINECPMLNHISTIETWLIPKLKISEFKQWINETNFQLELF